MQLSFNQPKLALINESSELPASLRSEVSSVESLESYVL